MIVAGFSKFNWNEHGLFSRHSCSDLERWCSWSKTFLCVKLFNSYATHSHSTALRPPSYSPRFYYIVAWCTFEKNTRIVLACFIIVANYWGLGDGKALVFLTYKPQLIRVFSLMIFICCAFFISIVRKNEPKIKVEEKKFYGWYVGDQRRTEGGLL